MVEVFILRKVTVNINFCAVHIMKSYRIHHVWYTHKIHLFCVRVITQLMYMYVSRGFWLSVSRYLLQVGYALIYLRFTGGNLRYLYLFVNNWKILSLSLSSVQLASAFKFFVLCCPQVCVEIH